MTGWAIVASEMTAPRMEPPVARELTDISDFAAANAPSPFWPLSRLSRPVEAVRQFTPNWFAATMGTGILAITLAQCPAHSRALTALAEGLWLFNIGLSTLFCGLYATRWTFFYDGLDGFSTIRPCRCSSAASRWEWPRSSTAF